MKVTAAKAHANWAPIIKEQRSRLGATDFYMAADRGGVTEESQAEFIEYRAKLRSIDHEFPHPDDVVWPEPPKPRKT